MSVVSERALAALPARPAFPTGNSPALWLVPAQAASAASLEYLDPDERRRADALLSLVDRDRYVTAHAALRRLSGAYLGLTPATVRIERAPCPACGGPHGRPVIPAAPLHFSLSHRIDRVLLAFAAVPVGVDLEAIPGPDVVRDTLPMLHSREIAEVSAVPEQDQPAVFARVWTRKEAYLKGRGVGLARGAAVDYVGAAERPQPQPGWRIADLAIGDGFAAAVAVSRVDTA